MKIIINPDFLELKEIISNLPNVFDKEGETIYKARNEIKAFHINGINIAVKKYRVPIFINQFAYSFLRKSKAERAYRNALEVISRGFDTPTPIAYIEIKKSGLLKDSYFISMQSTYNRLLREFVDIDIKGKEHIIEALGKYVAKMQEKEILHLDLSVGNILFEETSKGVLFSIIDINRMKFCPINQELGCKNFERLRGRKEFFEILAKSYAIERDFNVEKCTKLILKYNNKHIIKFEKRKRFKQKRKSRKNKS